MKRVFSTIGETCHAFAHDRARLGNGRNSTGNVYFQQNTIFSYGSHFPMAQFTETASGETCILITSEEYSVSTANHMRNLESAVSHIRSFNVPDVMACNNSQHLANWTELRSNLNHSRNELSRTRKPSQWHIDNANRCAAIANDYREAFDVQGLEPHQVKLVAFSDEDREAWRQKIDVATVREETLREAAREKAELANIKRIAAETIRDAKQARLELFERLTFGLYKAPRPSWKYGYQGSQSRKPSRNDKAELAAKISKWKRGNGNFPYGYKGPVLMRLENDRQNVRTSGNAVFPVSDCVSIWPAIAKAQADNARNDSPDAKLGMYRVDYINANGDIKAGCHNVSFAECRKLAIVLELIKPTLAERVAFKARKAFA